MYSALNKLSIIALGVLAVACSGGGGNRRAAEDLMHQAEEKIKAGDFIAANTLMDSVDRAYPDEIEVRRQVMTMRTQSRTQALEQQLDDIDAAIAETEQELNSLSAEMTRVSGGDAAGYFVLKGAHVGNFLNSNAVEARVSEKDGSYFITANCAPDKIGIYRIILSTSAGDLESVSIPDGDSRRGDADKFGTDLATFAPSEVDTLGAAAYSGNLAVNSVKLVGTKGSKTLKMSGAQAGQFGKVWRFGYLSRKLKRAQLMREKLEKQLIVSRDHSANMPTTTEK